MKHLLRNYTLIGISWELLRCPNTGPIPWQVLAYALSLHYHSVFSSGSEYK